MMIKSWVCVSAVLLAGAASADEPMRLDGATALIADYPVPFGACVAEVARAGRPSRNEEQAACLRRDQESEARLRDSNAEFEALTRLVQAGNGVVDMSDADLATLGDRARLVLTRRERVLAERQTLTADQRDALHQLVDVYANLAAHEQELRRDPAVMAARARLREELAFYTSVTGPMCVAVQQKQLAAEGMAHERANASEYVDAVRLHELGGIVADSDRTIYELSPKYARKYHRAVPRLATDCERPTMQAVSK